MVTKNYVIAMVIILTSILCAVETALGVLSPQTALIFVLPLICLIIIVIAMKGISKDIDLVHRIREELWMLKKDKERRRKI